MISEGGAHKANLGRYKHTNPCFVHIIAIIRRYDVCIYAYVVHYRDYTKNIVVGMVFR